MKNVIGLMLIGAGVASGAIFGTAAAYASGDAPWCAVTQLGEGAQAWDCQYETAEECVPAVITGNRGSCTPNPYAPAPATTSAPANVPAKDLGNTTAGKAAKRKVEKNSK
jgi:hypothetical protein